MTMIRFFCFSVSKICPCLNVKDLMTVWYIWFLRYIIDVFFKTKEEEDLFRFRTKLRSIYYELQNTGGKILDKILDRARDCCNGRWKSVWTSPKAVYVDDAWRMWGKRWVTRWKFVDSIPGQITGRQRLRPFGHFTNLMKAEGIYLLHFSKYRLFSGKAYGEQGTRPALLTQLRPCSRSCRGSAKGRVTSSTQPPPPGNETRGKDN